SVCGSPTDGNQQSLAYIAAKGGGTCSTVSKPGDLISILPGLISSQLTSLSLSDNGGTPTTITNTTPVLPVNGPGSATCTTTATATSNLGGYPIKCSGAAANATKYDISYQDNTLTVGQAASVVSGPMVGKVFGQADPSFTPVLASNGAPVPAGANCTAP